jgi:hypothetical protein
VKRRGALPPEGDRDGLSLGPAKISDEKRKNCEPCRNFYSLLICTVLHSLHLLDPLSRVFLAPKKPGVFKRAWPQALSWFIAVSSAIVAAVAYALLKGELPWLSAWF